MTTERCDPHETPYAKIPGVNSALHQGSKRGHYARGHRDLVLALALACGALTGDAESAAAWRWTLELDGKYTCTATGAVPAHNTDTHRGQVSFVMPDEAGPVQGKAGKYRYTVVGQTAGRPYQYATPGRLSFQGEVTPGELRFTPQVQLPDGQAFFKPLRTHTIPIEDGATITVEPQSVPEVTCRGPVRWTLRGQPRERYHLLIDDRVLIVKDHGVWSAITYRTGMTVQVLTEIEITIEGNKVIETLGSRRVGRLTPLAIPQSAWNITPIRGAFRDGHTYPSATPIGTSGVSAATTGSNAVKVWTGQTFVGGALSWTIVPKEARRISPDIQYGKPERFNQSMANQVAIPTKWKFPRRRNTTTTVEDNFDHLQVLQVTQQTNAMGLAPGVTTVHSHRPKYFNGDAEP